MAQYTFHCFLFLVFQIIHWGNLIILSDLQDEFLNSHIQPGVCYFLILVKNTMFEAIYYRFIPMRLFILLIILVLYLLDFFLQLLIFNWCCMAFLKQEDIIFTEFLFFFLDLYDLFLTTLKMFFKFFTFSNI